MKQLHFHAEQANVQVFVNGLPITLQGEVNIVVTQPTKQSRTNKAAWAHITKDNAAAVTAEVIQSV